VERQIGKVIKTATTTIITLAAIGMAVTVAVSTITSTVRNVNVWTAHTSRKVMLALTT